MDKDNGEDTPTTKKQHHPWDEVSLPGAGNSPLDQPTILQVLNPKLTTTTEESTTTTKTTTIEAQQRGDEVDNIQKAATTHPLTPVPPATQTPKSPPTQQPLDPVEPGTPTSSDSRSNLSQSSDESSTQDSCSSVRVACATPSVEEPPQLGFESRLAHQPPRRSPSADTAHVLDIESHLIETYDDYQANEELSVGINELPPIQDELTAGPSKIERDANVRTVIEVEPAGAKLKKPVETLLHTVQPQIVINGDAATIADEVRQTAEQLVNDIEEQLLESEVKKAAEKLVNDLEEELLEVEVKRAAEQLVNDLEEELLESEVKKAAKQLVQDLEEELLESEVKKAAEQLVNDLEEELLESEVLKEADQLVDEVEEKPLDSQVKESEGAEDLEREIRQAAEQFVADLERETLEAVRERLTPPAEVSGEEKTESKRAETESSLSQQVDKQLSEVTSILKRTSSPTPADVSLNLSGVNGEHLAVAIDQEQVDGAAAGKQLKFVNVPSPLTAHEAEERKQFIESLPQIEQSVEEDATKLAADCKREYYQSLKKYLVQSSAEKPPVPLQTYRWEDLKRAKERGGYPWTHLYKRPLGPDEEPEIVLLLRKSQELRFASESPKSLKKVRIDDQVSIKEAERYIQELSDEDEEEPAAGKCPETQSVHSESISCVSDSAVIGYEKPRKSDRFKKFRGILKRRRSGRSADDAQSLPGTSTHNSRHQSEENLAVAAKSSDNVSAAPSGDDHESGAAFIHSNNSDTKAPRCYPIMKKLKSMADRQKKRLNIKRITLRKDEKIVLGDETKIMRLRSSPKSDRSEIPHFIEKQDSDDVLEIVELDESPSRKHKDNGRLPDEKEEQPGTSAAAAAAATATTSIVQPDEIIEISKDDEAAPASTSESQAEDEQRLQAAATTTETETAASPSADAESPPKSPPKKTPRLRREHVYEEIEEVAAEPAPFEIAAVAALKQSLAKQDHSAASEMHEGGLKALPLDRMGSSEEEPVPAAGGNALLAPISSIDSTSSDEDRTRQAQLSPVAEESDAASTTETVQLLVDEDATVKSALKKEASPAPSDKKVTFSHVEDEAEPHREDIELPEEVKEAASKKWKNMRKYCFFCFLFELLLTIRVRKRPKKPNKTKSPRLHAVPLEQPTFYVY